ncbi:DEAD/DEAH box helicase family protein [Lacinutrix sp. MEBiC02595]
MSKAWSSLEFIFPWRSYQAKLLKNFETHILDRHFHVIAPPGSGKTILGIEIMRKLGKKTLVLAPTLTIRNQWENRLQSFFTKNKDFKSFSFDVKFPSDITFITYQSLHAFYKSFEDKNDYLNFFKKHHIETLVLDEAHHLKNAWWKCLFELKNSTPFFVVALTATPPYDSDRTEVSKYFSLCGEIDDEIAVPDLVKETDLCPHQDFVYFSKPEDLEIHLIYEYRQKIAGFKDELLQDETFISFIKEHRFYKNTEDCLDELYSNTEYFSAMLIFLNACGIPIDDSKLKTLGFHKKETINFPELYLDWLEILFQNLLVKDREQLIASEAYLLSLEKALRRLHVFDKNRVHFLGEELLYKSLISSPSKLKSIITIVNAESKSLQADLRCVVLTDYIRKEFLTTPESDLNTINKIGVIPIFQQLRCRFSKKEDVAVLTGSLVIIHQSIIPAFCAIEREVHFSFIPLEVDDAFVIVSAKTKTKNSIVSIITTLFENGKIKVLVGTKSLLGEGWDAPSINSLILASFIGSFVSSNQMRGRAIRKNPKKLNKTGNIWHLACVDRTAINGGKDVDTLRRRFEAFVGVANSDIPYISNGMDRLNIPEKFTDIDLESLNIATLKRATDRECIAKKWKNSIGNGTKLSKEVKIFNLSELPFKKQKQVYYFDVVRFFTIELFFSILLFYFEFIIKGFNVILQRGVTYFIYSFLAFFVLSFGLKLYKAITLYIRYGYLYKSIQKMGETILDSLYDLGHLTTSREAVFVTSSRVTSGDVVCNLVGSNTYENALFSSALCELLDAIDSPRYLIIKTSFFRRTLDIENFYPVPEIFGDRKENAIIFQKNWSKNIGRNKLFYTRHLKGRRLLLKARLFHVYNAFKKTSKEVTIWK